jgi:hypothetical protein
MKHYLFALQDDGSRLKNLVAWHCLTTERPWPARDLTNGSQSNLAVAIIEGARTVGSIRVE